MPTQQGTSATPAPATATAPAVAQAPATGIPIARPLTRREIEALRDARGELSNQLISAAERREELVEQLRGTEGTVRAGLEGRIAVLDKRLETLEQDIAETGRQLSTGMATAGSLVPPTPARGNFQLDPDVAMGLSVAASLAFIIPLGIAWMRFLWRRAGRVATQRPDVDSSARLERIEQAVDAIAIEVERVSESQRFQARLLSEGQGTAAFGQGARVAEPVRAGSFEPGR